MVLPQVQDARRCHEEDRPLHAPAHTHRPPEAFRDLPELVPVDEDRQGGAIPVERLEPERVDEGGRGDDGGVYPLYDLYAISHHVGDVGHGHYTAHARNRFDGAWYNFNDGRCDRIINDPTMRTEVRRSGGRGFGGSSSSSLPSAYCLFYHRVERVRGANGGDDVEKKTVIRRQSVSRPELWPHLQRAKAAEWASLRVTT